MVYLSKDYGFIENIEEQIPIYHIVPFVSISLPRPMSRSEKFK